MKKISRADMDRLTTAAQAVEAACEELRVTLESAWGEVMAAAEKVNEARQEAAEIMDDLARSAEEYRDERSDKWHESENGQAYNEWTDELRRGLPGPRGARRGRARLGERGRGAPG